MKDEIVTFETAKLACQKGFDVECKLIYNTIGQAWPPHYGTMSNSDIDSGARCTAPTQALLQRWLREKHKIFVYCIPKGFVKGSGRKIIRWGNNISIRENKYSSTYEIALESGLKEALKLIP